MVRRKIFTLISCALIAGTFTQTQARATSVESVLAAAHGLQAVPPEQWIRTGTWWTLISGRVLAPYPGPPPNVNAQIYSLGGDGTSFLVDMNMPLTTEVNFVRLDSELNWVLGAIAQFQEDKMNAELNAMLGLTEETDSQEGWRPSINGPQFNVDQLWLEVVSIDTNNNQISLRLNNTVESDFYQLESKTNLLQENWILGQIKSGDSGTNTLFDPITMTTPTMFFRAHQGPVVQIGSAQSEGVEPTNGLGGQVALLDFYATGLTNDLTVQYTISGPAQNGIDYTNDFGPTLSGIVTITNDSGFGHTRITLWPIEDGILELLETATFTLARSNTYLIDPSSASTTITINDNFPTNIFTVVTVLVQRECLFCG